MKRLRKWLKFLIMECLNEAIKERPMIIASRPPTKDDVYEVGSIWMHEHDTYIATSCNMVWEKR